MHLSILLLSCIPIVYSSSVDDYQIVPPHQDIIGGSNADYNTYEWVVRLTIGYSTRCTGSLISNNPTTILTAAHCFDNFVLANNKWMLDGEEVEFNIHIPDQSADTGVHSDSTGWKVISVPPGSNVIVYPSYDPDRFHQEDVALVFPSESSGIADSALPALPPPNKNECCVGNKADFTVLGYGRTQGSNPYSLSDVLQQTTVKYVPNAQARSTYQSVNILMNIGPNQLFYMADNGARGGCKGDSGGPVFQNGVVYGVISWGLGNSYNPCLPYYPMGSMNVAYFRDWINQEMGKRASKKNVVSNMVEGWLQGISFEDTQAWMMAVVALVSVLVMLVRCVCQKGRSKNYDLYAPIPEQEV